MAGKKSLESYDVIIVGAGPAGLTAGIYAARGKLKTLVIDKGVGGGTINYTHLIENYPGFKAISGKELATRMLEQAKLSGVELKTLEEVKKIEKLKDFKVITTKQSYLAKALIIASGTFHRSLNIPGEKEFVGKGVSYCATCDGPLFKDKHIAVIGCGNSGLQEGLYLEKFVKSITFIEFLPFITAEKILQERIKRSKKVRFLLNHEVKKIEGKEKVEAIEVKDRATNKIKKINVEGVFIYIGLLPNSSFLKNLVKLDEKGFVVTNEQLETSQEGIWAAGDVRSSTAKQIATAVGDGALAALNVRRWLESKER